jgi:hypothetical protein
MQDIGQNTSPCRANPALNSGRPLGRYGTNQTFASRRVLEWRRRRPPGAQTTPFSRNAAIACLL